MVLTYGVYNERPNEKYTPGSLYELDFPRSGRPF